MAAMLWLEEFHGELYDSLMNEVCSNEVIKGYEVVFHKLIPKVSANYKLSEDEIELLKRTYKRIKEI